MKSNAQILKELSELGVKSQVPKHAINELSSLLYDDMKITYALKFNSGTAVIVLILVLLFFSKLLLRIQSSFYGLGAVGHVLYIALFCFFIFLPSIWTKVVVFTNKAIFVFSAYSSANYSTISYQDIKSIRLVRNALLIETRDKKYKYSRLLGISGKKKSGIKKAIQLLLSEDESDEV